MSDIKKIKLIIFFSVLIVFIINFNNILRYFYPQSYNRYVVIYAEKYDLDPDLVYAVIKAESNFDSNALSNKGATGLMQIMPDTAEWIAYRMDLSQFKSEQLFDPDTNINMGCWYINDLNKEFNFNKELVLAAYNGGRGNVNKWLSDEKYSKDGISLYNIPFKETDEYVKKVMFNYKVYKKIYK